MSVFFYQQLLYLLKLNQKATLVLNAYLALPIVTLVIIIINKLDPDETIREVITALNVSANLFSFLRDIFHTKT